MINGSLANARCLVLGGGGFIGTNLCIALRPRVQYLRVFGRRMAFPHALNGVEWIQGDFRDATLHSGILTGCSTVIHLISATNPVGANINMAADVEANVISTLHFLDACRHHGVKRLIFISSGGTVYGVPGRIPTPEASPLEPITAYGISKLAIERYLHLHAHLYGLDYIVLRVSNPYGPYQIATKGQGVIAAFISNALRNEPIEIWGDGSVVRDYLHVSDVVNAVLLAMTHTGPSRIFNIGSGEGHSLGEIVSIIEDVVGHPVQRRHLGARKIDVPKNVLDVTLARDELGWRAETALQSGIRQTREWMQRLGPN